MERRGDFHLNRTSTHQQQSYRRRQNLNQHADPRRTESSNWRVRSESRSMVETPDPYLHQTTNLNSQSRSHDSTSLPFSNSSLSKALSGMKLTDQISHPHPYVQGGEMRNEVPIRNSQMLNVTSFGNLDERIARGPRMAGHYRPTLSTQNAGKVNNNFAKDIPTINRNQSSQTMKSSTVGRVTNNSSKRAEVTVPLENHETVGTLDNNKNNVPKISEVQQNKGKSIMGSVDPAPTAQPHPRRAFHLHRNGLPLMYREEGANWTYAPLKPLTRVSSKPNPNPVQQGQTVGSTATKTTGDKKGSGGQERPSTATPHSNFTMGPMNEVLGDVKNSRDFFTYFSKGPTKEALGDVTNSRDFFTFFSKGPTKEALGDVTNSRDFFTYFSQGPTKEALVDVTTSRDFFTYFSQGPMNEVLGDVTNSKDFFLCAKLFLPADLAKELNI